MENIYLLTGSNVGNRLEILHEAKEMIRKKIGAVIQFSHIYETEPWGYESSNLFYNQCLQVSTSLHPELVLEQCQLIENALGRIKTAGDYQDRILDVDILLFGNLIVDTGRLIIPHPRLHLRKFTLMPLEEIAAFTLHPVTGKSVQKMLEQCEDYLTVRKTELT